jgi:hypothetical protein
MSFAAQRAARVALITILVSLSFLACVPTADPSLTLRPAPTNTPRGAAAASPGATVQPAATTSRPPSTVELSPLARNAASFGGSWVNTDSKSAATGLTRLVIGTADVIISVRAFTACSVGGTPTSSVSQSMLECELGTRTGTYTGDPFSLSFDLGRAGVRKLALSFQDDKRTVLLVQDTGPGIQASYTFTKQMIPAAAPRSWHAAKNPGRERHGQRSAQDLRGNSIGRRRRRASWS